MMRQAVIKNDVVENIILLAPDASYTPPEGCILISINETTLVGIGWEYNGTDFIDPNPVVPSEPPVVSVEAITKAIAELIVVNGELQGIETATGLGAAFFIDVGLIWIMFTDPQPDTSYLPFLQCPGFNADVTARELDYFEVTVTDRVANQPAMPGSILISVQGFSNVGG